PLIQIYNYSLNSVNISIPIQEEVIYFTVLGLINKAKSKKFRSHYRDLGFESITIKPPLDNIIFEEAEIGDPNRLHISLSSLTK
ncbi:42720_t:CDS:1, partial [Gigaspora margarita]